MKNNRDPKTIEGFGREWQDFDQSGLSEDERLSMFKRYFNIFPWDKLPDNASGFDMGCGSGRWAKLVARRVGKLHCVDPSSAINVARENLINYSNCEFYNSSVDENMLPKNSMDFGYSIGVLHHIPDTFSGIRACVQLLKSGAPFLIYLYYAFDNRSSIYKLTWFISNILRIIISRLPYRPRYLLSQIIAGLIYFPFARLGYFLERLGVKKKIIDQFPLSYYRHLSFYTMRTDSLDRFGTRLEKRFTAKQIKEMLEKAGLENIVFSNTAPFWCAVGFRRK